MFRHEKPPVSWTLFLMSKKREAVQSCARAGAPFLAALP